MTNHSHSTSRNWLKCMPQFDLFAQPMKCYYMCQGQSYIAMGIEHSQSICVEPNHLHLLRATWRHFYLLSIILKVLSCILIQLLHNHRFNWIVYEYTFILCYFVIGRCFLILCAIGCEWPCSVYLLIKVWLNVLYWYLDI